MWPTVAYPWGPRWLTPESAAAWAAWVARTVLDRRAPPGDPASAGIHPAAQSPLWLAAKGRRADAEDVARKVGNPLPAPAVGSAAAASAGQRVGYAALFSREYILPTLLLGFMSFSGLLLTYGLNTWLPKIWRTAASQQVAR